MQVICKFNSILYKGIKHLQISLSTEFQKLILQRKSGYCMPRRGTAESCGNFVFQFLRNLTLFCIITVLIAMFTKNVQRSLFPMLFPRVFFITAILIVVRQNLIVLLICISVMIGDGEGFFQIFVGHSYIFFWEMCIQVFCSFF